MHVLGLAVERFRNLSQVSLQPHPRFNILYGENGQGKTNLIEAIYLLATLRSFRTSHMGELVHFGAESTRVKARVRRQGIERLLQVELGAGRVSRKQALVDGKPARTSEYFGAVNAVLFAPDDLRLPKGPPVARRRFLDRAVWNTCPTYLREVQSYERVLRSRNAVLRAGSRRGATAAGVDPPQRELLPVYDQQLAAAGAVLIQRRVRYLQALGPRVAAAFDRVTRTGLQASIHYRSPQVPQPMDPPAEFQGLCAALEEHLLRDQRRDLFMGYTHSGPHADDLEFLLGDRPASLYASQGQSRALILALKIAEIEHLADTLGDAPVLLLDDVSSELDAARSEHLFEFLKEIPCQTFITTTSPDHIRLPACAPGISGDRQDFFVIAGSIEPVI